MIKGEKISDDQLDEEYYREEGYRINLFRFEGVEGICYGIMDELDNLKKLIDVIGPSIVKEEEDFRKIETAEYCLDFSLPGFNTIAAWHKVTYREFTYKALFMLAQSIFENGLKDFYTLLFEEGRVSVSLKTGKFLDILDVYKKLDPSLSGRMQNVHAFNYIRNKISHNDGNCLEGEKGFLAAQKFIAGRTDVILIPVKNDTNAHKLRITRSTLLVSYIDFIKEIFKSLIQEARNMPFIAVN